MNTSSSSEMTPPTELDKYRPPQQLKIELTGGNFDTYSEENPLRVGSESAVHIFLPKDAFPGAFNLATRGRGSCTGTSIIADTAEGRHIITSHYVSRSAMHVPILEEKLNSIQSPITDLHVYIAYAPGEENDVQQISTMIGTHIKDHPPKNIVAESFPVDWISLAKEDMDMHLKVYPPNHEVTIRRDNRLIKVPRKSAITIPAANITREF